MTTFFRNVLQSEVGTTEEEIISVGVNSRVTVIGLSLTNLTGGIILASLRAENTTLTAPNNSAYFIKEVIIPPNQSLRVINGGEKLVLAGNMKLYVKSNTAASIDVIGSYVEIA